MMSFRARASSFRSPRALSPAVQLSRQQVLAGDGQLLAVQVAGQVDHFHPIEQRPGMVSSWLAVQMNSTLDRSTSTSR